MGHSAHVPSAYPDVVFIESPEVLDRLISNLWSGPAIIYVPFNMPPSQIEIVTMWEWYLPAIPLPGGSSLRFMERPCQVPSDSGEFRLATEPIKAKEVYDYLISLPYISDYVEWWHPPVVHELNGEDKREICAVRTCQFGNVNQFSILIDDSSRTVFLIKMGRNENTACSTLVEEYFKVESPGCGHNITYK